MEEEEEEEKEGRREDAQGRVHSCTTVWPGSDAPKYPG